MIAMVMMSANIISKMSDKQPEQVIDKSNLIDLKVTYKNGVRIVTPVEIK